MNADNIVKKNDFVELEYTGYANGEVFDSNIEKDLKKISPNSVPRKLIVCVGQKMIVLGFDKQLEEKEVGKDYEIGIGYQEGFGRRNRELVRIVPLSVFKNQKYMPHPGAMYALDNQVVKILAVSGARVTVDFNNPLAGKDLKYKFKIIRKIQDENEKVKSLFEGIIRFVPEFEIKSDKIVLKGPKGFEGLAKNLSKKFEELIGKQLDFEEKKAESKEIDSKN